MTEIGLETEVVPIQGETLSEREILQPSTEFTPGGIHSLDVRHFWETDLKANAWVLDTLAHGYVLPFHTEPETANIRNNLSARSDLVFVQQEVEKLHAQGVVEWVSEAPWIVSPLSVATNSKGKKRLCLDLSRTVNPCIAEQPVILADLKAAIQITEEGDWQAVYDLTSAYHHIKIYPPHVKYLGAAMTRADGSVQYFVYKYLPFGVSSAVHVMTKVMKPVSAHIATQGIRHTIYLDDGRVIANSEAQTCRDYATVLDILRKAGWHLAMDKSDTFQSISQQKQYLGFIIDSQNMSVRLSEEKEKSLRLKVQEIIDKENLWVTAKCLAQTLGKMISCAPALGRIPLIFARPAYAHLEDRVEKWGWSTSLRISRDITHSLGCFLGNIQQFNGHPINHHNQTLSLLAIMGPPNKHFTTKVLPTHVPHLPHEVLVSDASNVAVCSYSLSGAEKFFFIGDLQSRQMTLSSGHRELLAVKMALQARQRSQGAWERKTNIFWLTDSENLVVFLNKGSPKQNIQELVMEIMMLAKDLQIVLLPIHLRREDPRIKMADAGSRMRDSDDWSLDAGSFKKLSDEFGPFSIDLFADPSNAKTLRFYSDFLCPESIGIDAFAHSWDNEHAWIVPPVSKILKVFRKIRLSKLTAVLVVPSWQTANFWPFLFPASGIQPKFIEQVFEIHPIIVQNQRACSPLNGRLPYPFLVVIINSM